jgi:hypothetical protein
LAKTFWPGTSSYESDKEVHANDEPAQPREFFNFDKRSSKTIVVGIGGRSGIGMIRKAEAP